MKTLLAPLLLAVLVLLAGQPAAAGEPLDGKLLVATEQMPDPRFAGMVLLVLAHSDDGGALAVAVNRPLGKGPIGDLLALFGLPPGDNEAQVRLWAGGPVETHKALVVHGAGYGDATTRRAGKYAYSLSKQVLRALAAGNGPDQALVALGYAGWAPGQLEAELAHGDWAVCTADDDLVFGQAAETKWQRALQRVEVPL